MGIHSFYTEGPFSRTGLLSFLHFVDKSGAAAQSDIIRLMRQPQSSLFHSINMAPAGNNSRSDAMTPSIPVYRHPPQFTVILQVAVFPPSAVFTVIVAVPFFFAVTKPVLLTVATAVLLLVQVNE